MNELLKHQLRNAIAAHPENWALGDLLSITITEMERLATEKNKLAAEAQLLRANVAFLSM